MSDMRTMELDPEASSRKVVEGELQRQNSWESTHGGYSCSHAVMQFPKKEHPCMGCEGSGAQR